MKDFTRFLYESLLVEKLSATDKTNIQENVTCALFTLYFVENNKQVKEACKNVGKFIEWATKTPEAYTLIESKMFPIKLDAEVMTDQYLKSYYYQIKTFEKWCTSNKFDARKARYIQHNVSKNENIYKRVQNSLDYFNQNAGQTGGFPISGFSKDNYQKADIYAIIQDPKAEFEKEIENEIQYWANHTKDFIGISLKVINGLCNAEIENAKHIITVKNDIDSLKFNSTLFSELDYKEDKEGNYKIGGRSTTLKNLQLATGTEGNEKRYTVDFSIRTNTTSGNATLQFGALNTEIDVTITPDNPDDKLGKMNAQLGKAGLAFNIMMNDKNQKNAVLSKKATFDEFMQKLDELKNGPISQFLDNSFWLSKDNEKAIQDIFDASEEDVKKAEAAKNYKNALINILNFFIRINIYLRNGKSEEVNDRFNALLIELFRCAKGITKYNLPCLDLY